MIRLQSVTEWQYFFKVCKGIFCCRLMKKKLNTTYEYEQPTMHFVKFIFDLFLGKSEEKRHIKLKIPARSLYLKTKSI